MSCGIYKITNKLNNKSYIGQSKNIEQRWISHKYESINDKQIQYNYTIHRAFRKYGLDNFDFSIIELVNENQLNDREKYWINYYNTFNNGYNETIGGESGPCLPGERNPNAKLTEQDIINIRTELLNGKMKGEIYPLYADKISERGFSHIWTGTSWPTIMPEAIQYVHSNEYKTRVRSYAAQITSKERRLKIQERKQAGEKRLDVYQDYKNEYSLSGFNKAWYQK